MRSEVLFVAAAVTTSLGHFHSGRRRLLFLLPFRSAGHRFLAGWTEAHVEKAAQGVRVENSRSACCLGG